MSEFLKDLRRTKQQLFTEGPRSFWTEIRLQIAFKILPKTFAEFFSIVGSKLEMEYEKLDSEQRNKIVSLNIDFEFEK